jgi:hypothetical protein
MKNFTLICHKVDSSYTNRFGETIEDLGSFDVQFYRDHDQDKAVRRWARAEFVGAFADVLFLINGIPEEQMGASEYDEFTELFEIKEAHLVRMREEKEAQDLVDAEMALAEKAAKKLLSNASSRQKDMEEYLKLQIKLGLV